MIVSPDNNVIHNFLEKSARLYPDKCALVHGDLRIGYDELNRDANRVARCLIDSGVSPAIGSFFSWRTAGSTWPAITGPSRPAAWRFPSIRI
jgi:non-ribosomal peptide synthetase component F